MVLNDVNVHLEVMENVQCVYNDTQATILNAKKKEEK
jgi:hypothetical protein